ncbi:MAG: hypothetical protein AAFW82_00435 [Pseudomonadota bacterium]
MHAIEIAAVRSINTRKATHDPASTAAGVELAVLFFLGLFDRPADATLLDVVYPAAGALEPDPADLQQAATPFVEDPQKPSAPEWRERAGRWAAMQSAVTRLFGAAQTPEAPQVGERPLTEQEADDIREARRRVLLRRLFAGFGALDATGERLVPIQSIRNALGRLERRGLVAKINEKLAWEKTAIDCHPLVREYFGLRLKRLDPAAYRAAHSRLYDHLRFVGLPKIFRNKDAYLVLALCASFPNRIEQIESIVEQISRGDLSPEDQPAWPLAIFDADPNQLRVAAKAIAGPDWAAARAAFLPDDAAGMEPLFAAIRHGCEAEREDECFNEVYWPRVARGNEKFATKKLGLYGPELAALASFFAQPFDTPSPRLSEADRALVLNSAGYGLRAVGRLEDAVAPNRAAKDEAVAAGNWHNAGSGAETLSELLLVVGRVVEARTAAAEALTYARRVEQRDKALFRRMGSQVRLLSAAQAAGDLPAAEAAQLAAEALQAERQPELPRLYSLQGFLTAELLRARARTADAAARAAWSIELHWQNNLLLPIGLDQTTDARAALAKAVGLVDRGPLAAPNPALATAAEAALTALRRAAHDTYTPHGLLVAAEVRWRVGQLDASQELLRECEDRVVRGPMPLFHADLLLLRARIALSAGRNDAARTWRARAAELIETYSYGGARPELALLTAEIDPIDDNIRLAARAIRGDATIPQTEEHGFGDGWWGLLPRFRALAEARHPHFAQTLADLETAAKAYTTARDAWLKKTGGIPKP